MDVPSESGHGRVADPEKAFYYLYSSQEIRFKCRLALILYRVEIFMALMPQNFNHKGLYHLKYSRKQHYCWLVPVVAKV